MPKWYYPRPVHFPAQACEFCTTGDKTLLVLAHKLSDHDFASSLLLRYKTLLKDSSFEKTELGSNAICSESGQDARLAGQFTFKAY